jgi:subtilase family serine protease
MTRLAVFSAALLLFSLAPIEAKEEPLAGGARMATPQAIDLQSLDSPSGYSPEDIRNAYGISSSEAAVPARRLVAIVVAFHQPRLEDDVQRFISAFRLPPLAGLSTTSACDFASGPHPCFRRVGVAGTPLPNPAWALETALDVEWTHALSTRVDVLLMEAQSNRVEDLLQAVDRALAWQPAVVLMSWGTPETEIQLTDDHRFDVASVAFIAPIGDAPGMVSYPAASRYVIAVGGTSLTLDQGKRKTTEVPWSMTGGGVSRFEPQPDYQATLSAPFSVRSRTVPDVAAHADTDNGYAVLTSDGYGQRPSWHETAGSSAAAVVWTGIVSLARGDCRTRLDVEPYVARLYEIEPFGRPGQSSYDLAVGLGVPDGRSLLPRLCVPGGMRSDAR